MSGDAAEPTVDDRPLSSLRRRLARTLEVIRGADLDVRPFLPGEDGSLASFDPPADHDEVERYWVNAPYAYVVVTYDTESDNHVYHAVEPELDDFEFGLLERIVDDIRDPLLYRADPGEPGDDRLRDELATLLEQYGVDASMETFHSLLYYLRRDFRGYGKIDALLSDRHIEDISCDGYDLPIFVYHDEYTDIETNVVFGADELDNYVIRLAQRSGQHISVGDPVVGTTLPDGSRAELALGEEVTPRGSAFTIRQYAEEPFTPIDLIEYGTFSIEQMAYFWLCIEHNKSLIFAGGTASGKTTSMNAVSMFIPPRSKVLTIEDTRELSLYHDNWLSSVTREQMGEGEDIDMYDLLRSALRHRPEYIIVGEVRGEEALTLFQAMNTGHTTFSTMHADSIETVINRLENEPINVPRSMVQSLDLLSVQTLARFDGGRVRRAKTVGEIGGVDQRTGELDYSSVFEWDAGSDSFARRDSALLEEIQSERGWSRSDLLSELRDRRRFLEYLQDNGVTDYRRFTALVNEYYADPDRVMDRMAADDLDAEHGTTHGEPTDDGTRLDGEPHDGTRSQDRDDDMDTDDTSTDDANASEVGSDAGTPDGPDSGGEGFGDPDSGGEG